MAVVSSFWVRAALADAGDAVREVGEEVGWAALQRPTRAHGRAVRARLSPSRQRRWDAGGEVVTPFRVSTLACDDFPQALRHIDDPPPVLFIEGDLGVLRGALAVAVVGTRRATTRAAGATRLMVHHLARHGVVTVSGLARGIDAAAHRAAVEAGGPTVAVLGHGLAFTSPRSNRDLRRRIVEAGGAVVSSWPDSFEASRLTFPRRNRWIAALSSVTVVMQAGARSGASITARHALSLGRPVRAYLPLQGDAAYAGCQALLEGEATPLGDPEVAAAELAGAPVGRTAPWLRLLFAGQPLVEVARAWGGAELALAKELVRLELEGVVVRRPGGRYAPGKELSCHLS